MPLSGLGDITPYSRDCPKKRVTLEALIRVSTRQEEIAVRPVVQAIMAISKYRQAWHQKQFARRLPAPDKEEFDDGDGGDDNDGENGDDDDDDEDDDEDGADDAVAVDCDDADNEESMLR